MWVGCVVSIKEKILSKGKLEDADFLVTDVDGNGEGRNATGILGGLVFELYMLQ
jgi:hypothetical protein